MNGYDTSPTPRSPEAYQKRNSSVNNYNYPEDDLAKRVFHVDTLHVNKEKKLLFNKIDTDDSNYFPFGTPGGGAPLRNSNDQVVSRLPNINDNLWNRFPANGKSQSNNDLNSSSRKKEMLNLIDSYAGLNPSYDLDSKDFSYLEKRSKYPEHRYDPVFRSHIKPDHYWNDWFGRPGAGAPNYSLQKQNIDEMLESRRSKDQNHFLRTQPPYNPTINSMSGGSQRRFRSDHHNNYEIAPR